MSTVQRSRSHQRSKKALAPRSSRIEALEARRVLAAPTLGDLPAEINIASGGPIHLALDGQDAYFANLRYVAENLGINMDSDSESDDDSLSDTGVNFREPEPRLEDENFDVTLVEESDVQR